MSVVPFPGHSEGQVTPRTRMDTGAQDRRTDAKSAAPGRLLTFQAVADRCDVSVWTVRAWVDADKLKVLRLPGRLVRVDPADLAAFLEACR